MQTAKSRTNRGLIAGIAAGVVVILALGVVLVVAMASSGGDSTPTVATRAPAAPTESPGQPAPDDSAQGDDSAGTPADATQTAAIRGAMQRYIDAYNSGNVDQIKAATCTGLRDQVRTPRAQGTVVLDDVSTVLVNGDVARSLVATHLTVGDRSSQIKTDKASFSNEQGTWYFCPNAQPSYST